VKRLTALNVDREKYNHFPGITLISRHLKTIIVLFFNNVLKSLWPQIILVDIRTIYTTFAKSSCVPQIPSMIYYLAFLWSHQWCYQKRIVPAISFVKRWAIQENGEDYHYSWIGLCNTTSVFYYVETASSATVYVTQIMDDFEVISISNDYSEIDRVHYGMLPSQWPFQQSNGKLKLTVTSHQFLER